MEAGSRGAYAAGKSIGYTTYYDPPKEGDNSGRPYGGDPKAVYKKYNDKEDIITDGLIFSSIAVREMEMILHSAAIVIGPGG